MTTLGKMGEMSKKKGVHRRGRESMSAVSLGPGNCSNVLEVAEAGGDRVGNYTKAAAGLGITGSAPCPGYSEVSLRHGRRRCSSAD